MTWPYFTYPRVSGSARPARPRTRRLPWRNPYRSSAGMDRCNGTMQTVLVRLVPVLLATASACKREPADAPTPAPPPKPGVALQQKAPPPDDPRPADARMYTTYFY